MDTNHPSDKATSYDLDLADYDTRAMLQVHTEKA